MAEAEVGNDAFGEDPSVNRLEELAASMLGKEAALFAASGTMANLVSLLTFLRRGQSVILERTSHIMLYEMGSLTISGALPICLRDGDGRPDPNEVEEVLKTGSSLKPALIALENTHCCSGGTIVTPDEMRTYRELADKYGASVYVDGARIFNSAIALGIDAKELAADADALMFCLSKGLCAPVGSVIVGTASFIRRARQNRMFVGGQMRQAGVIAAAGTVALETTVERLKEDHDRARGLAEELAEIDGITVDQSRVQTNMVFFETRDARRLAKLLERRGVLVSDFSETKIRLITYRDITDEDIDYTLQAVTEAAAEMDGDRGA